MTDIHDMRTRLREERGRPVTSGAGFRIPFGVLAVGAVILGFVVVMLTPRLYSVQRTAALPDFKEIRERAESPIQAAAMTAPVPPSLSSSSLAAPNLAAPSSAPPSSAPGSAPTSPALYAGKNADEVAKIADAVCAQRVGSTWGGPPRRPAAVDPRERDLLQARKVADDLANPKVMLDNNRLSCFLSEGVPRFCSGGQKRKATADIINYFKGIEYANAALGFGRKVLEMPGPVAAPFKPDPAEAASRKAAQDEFLLKPDLRVVEAIEGLMRAGYLTKAHRDDIAASVPRDYKERFARIAGNKAPCPEPPWWAVWK